MSSKVIPSSDSLSAGPPSWRRTGSAIAVRQGGAAPDDSFSLRSRIGELEQQLVSAVEQARLEGRRSVEADATRAEAQLRDELARKLVANVAELVSVRNEMRRQMEEDLVRLAVVVARRVVRRELTVDPEALVGIARAALEQVESRELHRLRVAPAQAEPMKKLLAGLGVPARIAVDADAGLESGALILETDRGTIDASVDVQLAEIDRGLADVVRRSA